MMLLFKAKDSSPFGKAIRNKHQCKTRSILMAFGKDSKGIAAIEFGLVLPVIVMILMGFIALYDGMSGSRSIDHGASTIVDLVTRQNEMDDEKFDLLFATSQSLIGKYSDGDNYIVTITSVENVFDSSADSTLSVGWSKSNVTSAELDDSDLANFELPAIPEGGSVILVNIRVNYTPYISTDEVSLFEFTRDVVRRPRFLDNIPYIL